MGAALGEGEAWAEVPITAMVHGTPVPLTIDQHCNLATEERYAHCKVAMRAGLPVLTGGGDQVIERPCILVGSGPSAIPLLPELQAAYEDGDEIIAVKGAHDWLLENGIVPAAAIALDAQKARAKCFKRPHEDVLYLCASQMHPDTWKHLRGHRVLIWHSRIELGQENIPGWKNSYLVPACCTTGNSAIALLYLLGRRSFELYGFDSSIPPVSSRLQALMARLKGRPLKLDGARTAKGEAVIRVSVGGRHFDSTTAMVLQAAEMPLLLQRLPNVRVNAHGHGYYQSLLDEGKARGWPV